MNPKEQLLQEIQHSPELLIKEVLDFLLFAKSRNYPFVEPKVLDQPTNHLGICTGINARCPTRRTRKTASR